MSGKSQYYQAGDGLPARKSGHWAQTKLGALASYMGIVNKAMQPSWSQRCYIDLMAGGGKCAIIAHDLVRLEFDGSPLLAQQCTPPFTSLVLVEADARLSAALVSRLGADDRVSVVDGDCNDPATIAKVRSAVSPRALGIVFVDNLGLNVMFRTLVQLTRGRPWDLVVTFQVSALNRTVHLALTTASERDRWDAFFGTPAWVDVVKDFEAKRLTVREMATALLNLYARQLASIGYEHHHTWPVTMRNNRNAKLYTVELFSKHALGKKLAHAISPRREATLFDAL